MFIFKTKDTWHSNYAVLTTSVYLFGVLLLARWDHR